MKPKRKPSKAVRVARVQTATVSALLQAAKDRMDETCLQYVIITGGAIISNVSMQTVRAIVEEKHLFFQKVLEIETERAAENQTGYGGGGDVKG